MTDSQKESLAETEAPITPASGLTQSAAESRWVFINGWRVAPQPNDRQPVRAAVLYTVATGNGSPAARRSRTRRKHQAMFKEWSQARHD